jgi:hypothetical protein
VIRMRNDAMFLEPSQEQPESAAYVAARDHVMNLSNEDQFKLYVFMYKAFDHCRIYK